MDPTPCVVFDVDGTLADATHRLHFLAHSPKKWDEFFSCMDVDPVIEPVAAIARAFRGRTHLVCVSARPQRTASSTKAWMKKHDLNYWHAYYFREDGDRRDDQLVKKDILDRMLLDGWRPFLVFDDRQRVVDMWRANGIVCAQVAPGDF